MAVDYENLGELIDGYGGIGSDDLHALHEVALLRSENAKLRAALAEVELILTGLRGGIAYGGETMGRAACNAT